MKTLYNYVMIGCFFAGATGLILTEGCKTTTQTTAYNTIGSLEATVTGSYNGYCDSVIAGNTSTNTIPIVSKAYNQFQADALIAVVLVNNNTNALAPQNLIEESADFANVIKTATTLINK